MSVQERQCRLKFDLLCPVGTMAAPRGAIILLFDRFGLALFRYMLYFYINMGFNMQKPLKLRVLHKYIYNVILLVSLHLFVKQEKNFAPY